MSEPQLKINFPKPTTLKWESAITKYYISSEDRVLLLRDENLKVVLVNRKIETPEINAIFYS